MRKNIKKVMSFVLLLAMALGLCNTDFGAVQAKAAAQAAVNNNNEGDGDEMDYNLVIGWYENAAGSLSGLTETNVAEFGEELKGYLKEECGATDEQLADIVLRSYAGTNVAGLGEAVRADGDVDILIGVGDNVDVPNASGATAGLTVIEKAGQIAIANPNRYAALLTEKDIAKTVYDWIVKTYGPEQEEPGEIGPSIIYVDPEVVPSTWTDGVWVYMYDSTGDHGYSWPGKQITDEKDGLLVYELPADLQGRTYTVIFNGNNGSQIELGWKIAPGEKKHWIADGSENGAWVNYGETPDENPGENPGEDPGESSDVETVVYVSQGYLDSNGWDEVYLHVWDNSSHNTTWPGLKAELQEEGEWKDYWKVTVPDTIGLVGTISAILDNGSSGTGNQYDVGTMLWGETRVMTAGGEWMTEAKFKAPRVSASPDSPDFYGEELEVTLYAANVTDPTYQIDGGEETAYEDGDSLTVGADIKNGETVTLTLKGKNKNDETDIITNEYIYTKRYHEGQQSISVFFIGNSYTYYNDGVWSHFQKMAFEAGYNVDVDYVVIGSHYLDQFADFVNDEVGGGPTIEKKLAENDYDIVFLQEHSTSPLANYSRFENGATTLYNAIKESEGDDCRIILYQTWGRKTGSSNLTQDGRGWTNETMTYDLRYAYTKVGEKLGVEVSPVGTAFHDVYANNGDKIDMYDDDLTHPKLPGTYLAALVHLATVFNDDDKVIDNAVKYTAGLQESIVEILAQAAKDAPENAVKPHVYITPTDKDTITGSLTVNLRAINVDYAEYQINDGDKIAFEYGDTATLSEGTEKLTLYGYDSEGNIVDQFEKEYEYEPERYLVIGWYENNNLSGLTEANVAEFADALKTYLKEELGIAEELLNDIVLRPYVNMNVAGLGSSVKADGDVDILIGVGENVDVPNANGATAGLTVIEKAGQIGIANPNRYVALLTEKDIAKTVYDWIVKTYGPEQEEPEEPTETEEPEEPTETEEPEEPTETEEPDDTETPGTPGDTETPGTPDDTETPGTPDDTETPGTSGNLGNASAVVNGVTVEFPVETKEELVEAGCTTDAQKSAYKAIVDEIVKRTEEVGEDKTQIYASILQRYADEIIKKVLDANIIDIQNPAGIDMSKGVEVRFPANVNKGDTVIVLHLNKNGEWELIKDAKVNENGWITGTFTSLSPVLYAKVEMGYDGWAGVSVEQKAKLMQESLAQNVQNTQNAAVTAPRTDDRAPLAAAIVMLMAGAAVAAGAVAQKRRVKA